MPFSEVLLRDGRSDLGHRRPPFCHITFRSSVVSYLLKEGNHYLEFDNYQRIALVLIYVCIFSLAILKNEHVKFGNLQTY